MPRSTRRELIVTGLGVFAAASLGLPQTALARGLRRQQSFGGGGGTEFNMVYPRSVGLRHANVVDALVLNGQRYGGGGGTATSVEVLDQDEYIDLVNLRHGNVVDNLYMTTSRGRLISGGGNGGAWQALSDKKLRVMRIGGRFGNLLDAVKFEYVENYQPSTFVAEGNFVLDVRAPHTEYTEYQESTNRTFQAFKKTIESQRSLRITASAEAEYFASFSVETELNVSESKTESMEQSLDNELKSGQKSTLTVPENSAAFMLGRGKIMRDGNGQHWMYPTAAPNWIVYREDNFKELVGLYDMTSGAEAQAKLRSQTTNGFRQFVAAR